MGVLWGLLAAGLIGCADSAARITARRMPIPQLVLFTTWLALPLGLLLFGIPDLTRPEARVASLYALLAGVLHVGVLACLFRALADGPVSVAVAGTATNVVFLISWNILAGEPWHPLQLLAGFGVFLGVSLAARPERGVEEGRSLAELRRTALFGMGAGFLSSLRLFLVQESSEVIGAGDSLVGMRTGAALAILALLAIQLRGRLQRVRVPGGALALLVVVQVLLETGALLALLHGSVSASRIGAALGFATVPATSTLCARMFLGDPVGRRRLGWILFVVACVALATLAGEWVEP